MNIYITLDYELFLGPKTGSAENCLVRPMNALMDVLARTGSKCTVMVDGAYLYRMRQLSCSSDEVKKEFGVVLGNIADIDNRGHNIQYHFHPQWLYSNYIDGLGWQMDFVHYKLSDVPMDELSDAFKGGIDILEDLIKKKITAFRAGGYSLCSYEWYGDLFHNNGIKIDSSVRGGESVSTRFQVYDYRKAPRKSIYYFLDDVTSEVNEEKNSFVEMPISFSRKISSLVYLLKKHRMEKHYHPSIIYGDGKGVGAMLSKKQKFQKDINKLWGSVRMPASIDKFESLSLWDIYKDIRKQDAQNMVIIGHPKLASDASLDNVGRFVSDMIQAGNKICTFSQIKNHGNK